MSNTKSHISLLDTFNALNPENEKINELVEIEKTVIDNQLSKQNEKINTDYNTTRKNLIDLLATGKDALDTALLVAKDSEHPRAFEVVGNLMKQIADINEQLLVLSERKQKLDGKLTDNNNQGGNVTTNNSIFVGSTSELQKLINDMRKTT